MNKTTTKSVVNQGVKSIRAITKAAPVMKPENPEKKKMKIISKVDTAVKKRKLKEVKATLEGGPRSKRAVKPKTETGPVAGRPQAAAGEKETRRRSPGKFSVLSPCVFRRNVWEYLSYPKELKVSKKKDSENNMFENNIFRKRNIPSTAGPLPTQTSTVRRDKADDLLSADQPHPPKPVQVAAMSTDQEADAQPSAESDQPEIKIDPASSSESTCNEDTEETQKETEDGDTCTSPKRYETGKGLLLRRAVKGKKRYVCAVLVSNQEALRNSPKLENRYKSNTSVVEAAPPKKDEAEKKKYMRLAIRKFVAEEHEKDQLENAQSQAEQSEDQNNEESAVEQEESETKMEEDNVQGENEASPADEEDQSPSEKPEETQSEEEQQAVGSDESKEDADSQQEVEDGQEEAPDDGQVAATGESTEADDDQGGEEQQETASTEAQAQDLETEAEAEPDTQEADVAPTESQESGEDPVEADKAEEAPAEPEEKQPEPQVEPATPPEESKPESSNDNPLIRTQDSGTGVSTWFNEDIRKRIEITPTGWILTSHA